MKTWKISLVFFVATVVATAGASKPESRECSTLWTFFHPLQCMDAKTSFSDPEIWAIIEEGSIAVAHVAKKDTWWGKMMSSFRPASLVRIFSWDAIKDVVKAIHNLVALIVGAFADFWKTLSDFFKSNAQLALEAKQRYEELDADVTNLVKKHKSLSQMCHHPADNDAWSECNKAMIQSTDDVVELVRQRRKVRRTYENLRSRVSSGDW